MAHEIDMSNNRANVAYRNEVPWHRLGSKMPENADIQEWKKTAGLDWEAMVAPLLAQVQIGDEEYDTVECLSNKALIRSDTHDVLSVVSNGYKPVQPSDIMDFFVDLVDGIDAGFKMETAGSLRGGRKIWALAKNELGFNIGGNDQVDQYMLMATSFDRSLPTIALLTSVRVVCANTLHVATKGREGIRITHNRKFDPEKTKEILGISKWQIFSQQCTKFADRKMEDDESRRFVAECLATLSPTKDADYYYDEQEDNDVFKRIWDLRQSAPGQQLDTAKGTLWGDVGAITYYVDHDIKAKSDDNRLDSQWFGRGARVKNFAYDLASTLV